MCRSPSYCLGIVARESDGMHTVAFTMKLGGSCNGVPLVGFPKLGRSDPIDLGQAWLQIVCGRAAAAGVVVAVGGRGV
jgi:hypothetical protein